MGSMNNWLGFSPFSGADDDANAILNPPQQEWEGMKGMVMVAAAADEEEPPKLEDFLGMQEQTAGRSSSGSGGVGGNPIGLSMIKNWLRNQPAPAAGVNEMALMIPSLEGGERVGGSSPEARGHVTDGAAVDAAPKKAADTFGQRTSIYRGVTKHRWTGRYEAHLWDNSCRREGQTRKGRQVYLGGYDKEDKAARAYDLAALKYWGNATTTNFPLNHYEKELEEMKHMTRQEYIASLRRKSSGFSRGASIYRGVTRHHQHGRWQARIGRVAGNKDLYLGTFSTQEEAAEAYDIAAIKFRGLNAVTNFDMSRYDVKSIIESGALPISGTTTTKRLKDHTDMGMDGNGTDAAASQLTNAGIGSYGTHQHNYGYTGWSPVALQPMPMQYANGQSRMWCKQEQDSTVVAAAQNLHSLHHFPSAVDGTHNFFQPLAVQDMMDGGGGSGGVEVPSPSEDSSSFMYNGAIGYHGAVAGGWSYGMPVLGGQGQGNHASGGYREDGVVGGGTVSSDLYVSRDVYYLPQDSPDAGVGKDGGYELDVGGNSWDSSAPVMEEKADPADVTVCHGLPLFSVWHDA